MHAGIAADIVETILLASADGALGYSQIIDIQRRIDSDFQFRIDFATNHMRRRQMFFGDIYPFEIEDFAIRKRPECNFSPYVTLLVLSPEGIFRFITADRNINRVSLEFENFVAIALKGLSGPGTQSVRFGYPSDEGRPKEFPAAISWLGEKMGISLGQGFRPPRRKDGGVDVIAWRRFKDGKSAFPIFLVQCTVQSELVKKTEDIDIRNWAYWLDFSRDPQPILAVPHEISNHGEEWNELNLKCLVLDRFRLLELLQHVKAHGESFDFDSSTYVAEALRYIEGT